MKMRVIVISFILLLSLIFYIIVKNNSDHFSNVVISHNNEIRNLTEFKYIDTIVSIGLDQLKIYNQIVSITELTQEIKDNFRLGGDIQLQAFIIQREENHYLIFVTKLDKKDMIETISHELIHLEQYHTRRLRVIDNVNVMWLGLIMDPGLISYENRPWEIEAFQRQSSFGDTLTNILYNK